MFKDMKKGIIWRRGSTDRQEIQSQDAELTKLALSEGFKEENLIHLGEAGASAIKQNYLYVQEVEKLISTLENDKEVRYVFVWEVSRLARVELAFYQMKDYFIKNKIQLVCKTPSIRLFDEDWTVNKGAEVTLSLLVVLAKQEMEIKSQRMKRGRERNKAEGKFNGGKCKIGYRLDSTNHFAEDDEKAETVRKIFHWYVEEGLSLRKIQQRLCDMGIYTPAKNYSTEGRRVRYILSDRAYIGENNYPRIIENSLFEKAQKRLSDRHKDKQTNNVYFCKGIIRDKATGASLIARKDTRCYLSKHKAHPISVNLNAMDYVALFSSNILIAKYNSSQSQANEIEYRLKIEENEKTIESKKRQIEDVEKMNQRAIEANIRRPEHFPEAKLETLLRQNERLSESLKTAISDIESENTRLREWLDGKRTLINEILEVSDEKKKEMIDTVIKTIWIEEIGKNHFRITIENKLGYIDDTWFEYLSRGRRIGLFLHYPDGRILDLTPSLKNHRRY